jgi:hypothetical protein
MPGQQSLSPERRKARAQYARAAQVAKRHPDDAEAQEAAEVERRDYYATALGDHIREVVAKAPPLSTEQRDRLAVLLRGET